MRNRAAWTSVKAEDLLSFLAVGETGSFRKAANQASIGQSAISRRVQRLEDMLGVSLFERRASGAMLTTAGLNFAARSREILIELNSAVEMARHEGIAQNGELRIGLVASLSKGPLRDVIEAFVNAHSKVDLSLIEADRSELLTLLSHRSMDVIIAAGDPEKDFGDGFVLCYEKTYLAVPSNHQWAALARLSWNEVREATFGVSAHEPGPEIHEYIIRRIINLGRSTRVTRHRLGREGIMTLVGLGLGVSLVADHWRVTAYPNVTFVPIGDEEENVPFSITWRPENDNPALRRFISLARMEAKGNGALSLPWRTRDRSP